MPRSPATNRCHDGLSFGSSQFEEVANFGPVEGQKVIILLAGGDKKNQPKEIKIAISLSRNL